MMVSKHPITKRDSIVKDVYEIQSGALYGEVNGVQIVCAHHSQDNKRNNMYELLLALDLLNEKDNCSPQVLMGDLNTGLKPQFKDFVLSYGDPYDGPEVMDEDNPAALWGGNYREIIK